MDIVIRALIDGILVPLVDGVVAPVAGSVPILVSSGLLLAIFGAVWAAFAVAIARSQISLDLAWRRMRRMPLAVQAIAWLLFLPVLAGLWIWRTSWPLVARLVLICGVAGWNLLVFVPRPA